MIQWNVYEQRLPFRKGDADHAHLVLMGAVEAANAHDALSLGRTRYHVLYPLVHELDAQGKLLYRVAA